MRMLCVGGPMAGTWVDCEVYDGRPPEFLRVADHKPISPGWIPQSIDAVVRLESHLYRSQQWQHDGRTTWLLVTSNHTPTETMDLLLRAYADNPVT